MPIKFARTLLLAAVLIVPSIGAAAPAPHTTYARLGYNLELLTLPDFANTSSFTSSSHGMQYPTYDFSGKYAGDILYIGTNTTIDYYDPSSGGHGAASAPVALPYEKTAPRPNQIDNEFQMDTPYDVALLYGNLTTAPGNVTVEVANLTNGEVHIAVTPVTMGGNVQADYVGNGTVVTFSTTNQTANPTYFTNVYNDTSWYSGESVGMSADNVYWVWPLHSFIDIQGKMISQYKVESDRLVLAARMWLNDSSVTSVTSVNGAVYDGDQLAFWEATDAGWYYLIVNAPRGTISQTGSYSYFSDYIIYVQRYTYTTDYVWAVDSPAPTLEGPTFLFDPFNNSTQPAPDLIGRQEGSGANSNFEFQDPFSTSACLSLNGSLVGSHNLQFNQIVWAHRPSIVIGGTSLVLVLILVSSAVAAGLLLVCRLHRKRMD